MEILDLNSEKLDKLITKFKTTPNFKEDLITKFEAVPDKCTKEEIYMIKSLLPILKEIEIELVKESTNEEKELEDDAIVYDFSTPEGIETAVLGMTLSLTISKHFPNKYKNNLVPREKQESVLEEILYPKHVDLSKRQEFFRDMIKGYIASGKMEGLETLSKKYKCNLSFVKLYNEYLKVNTRTKKNKTNKK